MISDLPGEKSESMDLDVGIGGVEGIAFSPEGSILLWAYRE